SGPPSKLWKRPGLSSGPAPFKLAYVGSISDVVEASEIAIPVMKSMQVSNGSRKPCILLAASEPLHFIEKTLLPKDLILYSNEDKWKSWSCKKVVAL
nr:hypothetical protein [Tanacetum cinerariifolium]GFA31940.1 hypothetical protein [Tanacetum cinerariifolium]